MVMGLPSDVVQLASENRYTLTSARETPARSSNSAPTKARSRRQIDSLFPTHLTRLQLLNARRALSQSRGDTGGDEGCTDKTPCPLSGE